MVQEYKKRVIYVLSILTWFATICNEAYRFFVKYKILGGDNLREETLIITGMTCASCAKAVERHVGRVDGVVSANVNLATEKLTVKYDESVTDVSNICEAVIKAGYGVLRTRQRNGRSLYP